jgi:hypothetical protein
MAETTFADSTPPRWYDTLLQLVRDAPVTMDCLAVVRHQCDSYTESIFSVGYYRNSLPEQLLRKIGDDPRRTGQF